MSSDKLRSRWKPIAEGVFCPVAAAWGERGVAVFARGPAGELLHLVRDRESWSTARSLGPPAARSRPSLAPVDWPIGACSTGDGEIHLLARGPEGDLLHGRLRGADWGGFESMGVPVPQEGGGELPVGLGGPPTACSRDRGQMDVFAVDGGGKLLQTSWDGAGFTDCASLGVLSRAEPVPFGALAAFSAGGRAMGIVARASSGDLLVRWWKNGRWSGFVPLHEVDPLDPARLYAFPISGPPAACGGGSARADVFARGPRGDLLHTFWDGNHWSTLESLGMPAAASTWEPIPFTGGPIACAWGKYRLDVFACAADGKLYNADGGKEAPGASP